MYHGELNSWGFASYYERVSMTEHLRARALEKLGDARLVKIGGRPMNWGALYRDSYFRVIRRGGRRTKRRFKSRHEGLMEFKRDDPSFFMPGWAAR